jgi:DDB1- and CUL4-associated factor 4
MSNHPRSANKASQGLAVDLENDFVYAAGQDCRIRAWRLATGEPLEPSSPSPFSSRSHPPASSQNANPFLATFEDPVEVLQVTPAVYDTSEPTEGQDDDQGKQTRGVTPDGMCLWAASGRDLWRWNLGQRDTTTTSSCAVRSILR